NIRERGGATKHDLSAHQTRRTRRDRRRAYTAGRQAEDRQKLAAAACCHCRRARRHYPRRHPLHRRRRTLLRAEDNLRRLQSRMTKLLGISQPWPKWLQFYCEMPRLTDGGLEIIKGWIEKAERPRLIIIDTLAMVRAKQTQYDADYYAVVELRTLANECGIAVVVVHHLRKMDADDAFDTVSGTLGLTGAPDTI